MGGASSGTLDEQLLEFKNRISFDSEASMFVVYSQREDVQKFGEKLALLYQDSKQSWIREGLDRGGRLVVNNLTLC